MTLLSKLLAVLAVIAGFIFGYQIGHYFGKADGLVIERAKTSNAGIQDIQEATTDKEKIKDETRKIPDSDLIHDMRVNGWLRD